ncbi:MAG: S1 RNA-binding domain-containing protein [Deltaproteobacteria bacterium]|nr:S1 RNA-binding domain-containing protein [Deltaproteobacteria bacterium]
MSDDLENVAETQSPKETSPAPESPATSEPKTAPAEVADEPVVATEPEAAPEPVTATEPAAEEDFASALAAFEESRPQAGSKATPKVGEKITGRIVSFSPNAAFVDLGIKAEGIVELSELTDSEGNVTAALGDTIEAQVSAIDGETGSLKLRVRPGGGSAMADELRQAYENRLPVEGKVGAVNKGGVDVFVGTLRAFCPISQLERGFVEDATAFVGGKYLFRITRFEDDSRGRGPNIVVSRRALLEEEARAKAEETRAKLHEGAIVRGTVSSLAAYGAFVDLGGLEGLLHVSEIEHTRIEHPKEALAVGQMVEVKVLKIESGKDPKTGRDRDRISLSRKALATDPWEEAVQRFSVGTTTQGKVVRTEVFGAFVELAPGLDGLLHISELANERRLNHAREAVELGQSLEVTVRAVETDRRRISLALASSTPEYDLQGEAYQAQPSGGGGFGAMADFFKKAGK